MMRFWDQWREGALLWAASPALCDVSHLGARRPCPARARQPASPDAPTQRAGRISRWAREGAGRGCAWGELRGPREVAALAAWHLAAGALEREGRSWGAATPELDGGGAKPSWAEGLAGGKPGNGYHSYCIYFYICVRIRSQIQIVLIFVG
ncbi:hypothetical protein PVAP13_7KG066118 [Panicum virgatum]|uniref:Uncharacterized protein n=1 Tax=Panicum virgatum TaxID=38727 RepID=A0A8T0QAP2_PANVG|nr:hypothetical protein PVAP13_7KG066118 [Panicum virgatum]